MATVPHVASGLGLRKFQADGFLLTRVYTLEHFASLVAVRVVFLALTQHCNLPELLGREVMKEGEKLADILSMPVKDALGRDVEVNYESDIANVLELLDATVVRKNIFSDSVELHKLTLAQVAHVRAYERDAAQAVQWLDDLFQVSRYPSLCCLQGCEQAFVTWDWTWQRAFLKNTHFLGPSRSRPSPSSNRKPNYLCNLRLGHPSRCFPSPFTP